MKEFKIKKIQFIPGLGEKSKDYKELSKHFEVLNPDWNKWETKPKINKPDILITFSLGGWMAIDYTEKNKVKNVVFCSLTPGLESFSKFNVKVDNVIFIVGEKEEWVIKEIKRVRKTLKCPSKLVIVPGADHEIKGGYEKKLIEIIEDLKNNGTRTSLG